MRRNCCASVGGFSRAGGDGGCVAGLSVVWCARSGCGRCALFPVGRCRGVAVGRMHPVMRRHVSFRVLSTSLRCGERAQTGQQYSVTERHSAVAIVLVVWGHAPQFVPCSFLRRLFLEESFARVFMQWFR